MIVQATDCGTGKIKVLVLQCLRISLSIDNRFFAVVDFVNKFNRDVYIRLCLVDKPVLGSRILRQGGQRPLHDLRRRGVVVLVIGFQISSDIKERIGGLHQPAPDIGGQCVGSGLVDEVAIRDQDDVTTARHGHIARQGDVPGKGGDADVAAGAVDAGNTHGDAVAVLEVQAANRHIARDGIQIIGRVGQVHAGGVHHQGLPCHRTCGTDRAGGAAQGRRISAQADVAVVGLTARGADAAAVDLGQTSGHAQALQRIVSADHAGKVHGARACVDGQCIAAAAVTIHSTGEAHRAVGRAQADRTGDRHRVRRTATVGLRTTGGHVGRQGRVAADRQRGHTRHVSADLGVAHHVQRVVATSDTTVEADSGTRQRAVATREGHLARVSLGARRVHVGAQVAGARDRQVGHVGHGAVQVQVARHRQVVAAAIDAIGQVHLAGRQGRVTAQADIAVIGLAARGADAAAVDLGQTSGHAQALQRIGSADQASKVHSARACVDGQRIAAAAITIHSAGEAHRAVGRVQADRTGDRHRVFQAVTVALRATGGHVGRQRRVAADRQRGHTRDVSADLGVAHHVQRIVAASDTTVEADGGTRQRAVATREGHLARVGLVASRVHVGAQVAGARDRQVGHVGHGAVQVQVARHRQVVAAAIDAIGQVHLAGRQGRVTAQADIAVIGLAARGADAAAVDLGQTSGHAQVTRASHLAAKSHRRTAQRHRTVKTQRVPIGLRARRGDVGTQHGGATRIRDQ